MLEEDGEQGRMLSNNINAPNLAKRSEACHDVMPMVVGTVWVLPEYLPISDIAIRGSSNNDLLSITSAPV